MKRLVAEFVPAGARLSHIGVWHPGSSLDVCQVRAAEALKTAKETKLDNVRDLYSRSALRWSELAEQKSRLIDGRIVRLRPKADIRQ